MAPFYNPRKRNDENTLGALELRAVAGRESNKRSVFIQRSRAFGRGIGRPETHQGADPTARRLKSLRSLVHPLVSYFCMDHQINMFL